MTYRKSRSKILACKPTRIAFALLALATLIQISLPLDWTRLPSFLFPGIAFTALGFSIMIRARWQLGFLYRYSYLHADSELRLLRV